MAVLCVCRRHLLRIDQRHRVHADVLADDELHPRQANAVVGQHGCPERKLRIAEIEHDGGARPLELAGVHPRRLERQPAVIDTADVSLRAGHRHDLAGLQSALRSFRPDDGRHAELARDNGRVTGAPAALGHDRGRDLHDRLPVRARRLARREPRPAGRLQGRR